MKVDDGYRLELLSTGVPNLDVVLGGGIPVGSFNLIAGGPGTGKTTLTQQMIFKNASPERPALHFTVLGEPVAKLLRYQRAFSYFDTAKINTAIHFIDIGDIIRNEGLGSGLEAIVARVERYSPGIVVIDSVRAVREMSRREGEYGLRSFAHDLAQIAVVWDATSFMVGEYEQSELRAGPEFTIADGIIWMGTETVANSAVRKLEIVKSRGMPIVQGLHGFNIGGDGIYVYPRIGPGARTATESLDRARFGVPGLDSMLNGGIPRAEACLIAGASGTGKTILGLHFIAQGVANAEPCVAVIFEEDPDSFSRRSRAFGWDLARWEEEGKLAIVYSRPMDLTVDATVDDVRKALQRTGAKRLVLDSISGFELARSPADRSNFRESLHRLVAWCTSQGVTTIMITEVPEIFGELRFTTHDVSFVADNIILIRYAEIESELRKLITVVKMRGSNHDKQLRHYEVTERGALVGVAYREYTGLLSGVPTMVAVIGPQPFAPGLGPKESMLVNGLFGLGSATAQELVGHMGLPQDEMDRMLLDLVGKGYLVKETKEGEAAYYVAVVSWAPGVRRGSPGQRPRQGGPDGG